MTQPYKTAAGYADSGLLLYLVAFIFLPLATT
jgi:hypothetical protein